MKEEGAISYMAPSFCALKFIESALNLILFSISMKDEAGDEGYPANCDKQAD